MSEELKTRLQENVKKINLDNALTQEEADAIGAITTECDELKGANIMELFQKITVKVEGKPMTLQNIFNEMAKHLTQEGKSWKVKTDNEDAPEWIKELAQNEGGTDHTVTIEFQGQRLRGKNDFALLIQVLGKCLFSEGVDREYESNASNLVATDGFYGNQTRRTANMLQLETNGIGNNTNTIIDDTDEEPTVDNTDEEPTVDNTDEEPTVDNTDEEPTVDNTDEEPAVDNTDEEPAVDGEEADHQEECEDQEVNGTFTSRELAEWYQTGNRQGFGINDIELQIKEENRISLEVRINPRWAQLNGRSNLRLECQIKGDPKDIVNCEIVDKNGESLNNILKINQKGPQKGAIEIVSQKNNEEAIIDFIENKEFSLEKSISNANEIDESFVASFARKNPAEKIRVKDVKINNGEIEFKFNRSSQLNSSANRTITGDIPVSIPLKTTGNYGSQKFEEKFSEKFSQAFKTNAIKQAFYCIKDNAQRPFFWKIASKAVLPTYTKIEDNTKTRQRIQQLEEKINKGEVLEMEFCCYEDIAARISQDTPIVDNSPTPKEQIESNQGGGGGHGKRTNRNPSEMI